MNEIQMMYYLEEAMFNLKESYPHKEQAQRAFGCLMGILNHKPQRIITIIHEEWTEIKTTAEQE